MDQFIPAIGHIASQWFKSYSQASVQGITSTGIFLQLQDYRIIFLTERPDFGPVNVISNLELPNYWKPRDTINIQLNQDSLRFSHSSGEFEILNYFIWTIPTAPVIKISINEQSKRIKISVAQISTIKGHNGYAAYLDQIINTDHKIHTNDPIFDHIIQIRHSLDRMDSSAFLNHAKVLIGNGRGLTPSGDDFLCGILFLLNRWKFDKFPPKWIEIINLELLKHAQSKTTSASSTLIECAINGSADYRIQELSDALMNESIPFHLQAIQLARWGNSSGADLFAGLLIGLQTIFILNESGKPYDET